MKVTGKWTDEDINTYLKNHPDKFIIDKREIFIFNIGETE